MSGGIHGFGMKLTNALRPAVAGHDVRLKRGAVLSEVFSASSPPVGNEILEAAGIGLGQHERAFFWEVAKVVDGVGDPMGLPQRHDVVIDESDGSEWPLLPIGNSQDVWRWHGQTRESVLVITKKGD